MEKPMFKMTNGRTAELFDLSHTLAAPLLAGTVYPHEVLPLLSDFIMELGKRLPSSFREISENVWAHESVKIALSATLIGPAILCAGCELRPGAYLRGSVLVGENAVIGNSTEVKNAILFDRVAVPHFNYVGDSVLGFGAHLGAGAVISNVRADKAPVLLHFSNGDLPTGRKKVGAMVGDGAEIGCHAVLCPGTVLGKNVTVYPLSMVRGVIPAGCIFKRPGEMVPKH